MFHEQKETPKSQCYIQDTTTKKDEMNQYKRQIHYFIEGA